MVGDSCGGLVAGGLALCAWVAWKYCAVIYCGEFSPFVPGVCRAYLCALWTLENSPLIRFRIDHVSDIKFGHRDGMGLSVFLLGVISFPA